ncbi:uncharacterized protein C2orf81 homolog isoform X2 [Paramormyrops kingsleyae]|nr:uncharacterized protein C2orf81 homolog isoform X2 [Paramormyrops kingsleyae]XP_023673727.1 uncharacterized protein C2orf81 homolog isoform X2 [Paramormyrops kingsleyae]
MHFFRLGRHLSDYTCILRGIPKDYLVRCLQVTMPRSVKSRKVKGHPVPVPTPSIPVQLDVIRGPLFMPQWCKLVAQEQGEEVVVAILDKLINDVTEKCYKMHQERQLVPFVASLARNILVKLVEAVSLKKDEGEDPDAGPLWEEDSEPQPCPGDSWAQFSVPLVYSRPQVTVDALPQKEFQESLPYEILDKEHQNHKKSTKSQNSTTRASKPVALQPETPKAASPLKREQRRKKPQHLKVAHPIPNAPQSVQLVAELSNQKEDLGHLKNQLMAKCSPERLKLPKLDACYPRRQAVWPGFEVLSLNTSLPHSQKVKGRSATEKLVNGRPARHNGNSFPTLRKSPLNGGQNHPSSSSLGKETNQPQHFIPSSSIMILDSTSLSPGVTQRNQHDRSSKQHSYALGHRQNLQPIISSVPLPLHSGDQLTFQHRLFPL